MKYIKQFDDKNTSFNIGDYVIGDVRYITGFFSIENEQFFINNVGEVINKKFNGTIRVKYNNKFLDIFTTNYVNIKDHYSLHLRLANKNEIEKFKLEKDINKFNL